MYKALFSGDAFGFCFFHVLQTLSKIYINILILNCSKFNLRAYQPGLMADLFFFTRNRARRDPEGKIE